MGLLDKLKDNVRKGARSAVDGARANITEARERRAEEKKTYSAEYRKQKLSQLKVKARTDAKNKVMGTGRPVGGALDDIFGVPQQKKTFAGPTHKFTKKKKKSSGKKRNSRRVERQPPPREDPWDFLH